MKLKAGSATVNTPTKRDRVLTQIVLTPDNRFLMGTLLFDHEPKVNHPGNPTGMDVAVSNKKDKDGLVMFSAQRQRRSGHSADRGCGRPGGVRNGRFCTAATTLSSPLMRAATAWRWGKSVVAGKVTHSPIVAIDISKGMPSELCWLAITPDNRQVLATAFGFSTVSSYKIANGALQIAHDPAAPAVPGDGTFKALDGLVSSGPNDNLLSPDGKFFYQIYPNASKLIAYQLSADGELTQIDEEAIPYTSPQGLAGFLKLFEPK